MRKLLLSLLLALGFVSPALAVDFPTPTGYVTDTVNLLTAKQNQSLTNKLEAYEGQTGTEIAILIVNSTLPLEISEYATQVGNAWGVGKANVNNGILMVAAMEDHDFFMAIGSQMESAVSDGEAGNIWREIMRPYFREEDYYTAFSKGIDATIEAIAGETFTSSASSVDDGSNLGILLFFVIILGLFIWLGAVLGRSKAIWPGAAIGFGGGGGLALFSGADLGASIFVGLFFGILGLIFDAIVSGGYNNAKSSGKNPPWWSGGGSSDSSSSGSSSSGGFGGFGGGGFSGGGGGGKW